MRYRLLLACMTLTFASTIPTRAQATDVQQADINARADEQFRKGREEQDRGNCQKALEHFRESHALKPGRGTLLNMGLCEKKLGQLAKALQHLEELLPQLPAGDERRQIVREALSEIKPKVPYLRIVLSADSPAGTSVSYDHSELPSTMVGTDMPVDPGKHSIVVESPGRPDRHYDVFMEEGKRQTLAVEVGVVKPSEPIAQNGSSGKGSALGWIVLGAGAAGFVTAAITGALASRDYEAAERSCPTHRGCSPQAMNAAELGKTESIINTVALGVGIVGAGVGIPLLVMSIKKGNPSSVGVWVSPDGARLGWSGRF